MTKKYRMEKAMAPHSSTLAWKIPWTEESGSLQSMGSLRVRHNWATSLSLFTFTFHFHALEKDMATHSSVLAWRIPGAGEPGGLPSLGSHRVGYDWSDLAAVKRNIWKKACPFLLLENSRPLSPLWNPQTPLSSSGTPDFLSTYLEIDSLNTKLCLSLGSTVECLSRQRN